jgi:tetratricopeptide (TPR) repeat protein
MDMLRRPLKLIAMIVIGWSLLIPGRTNWVSAQPHLCTDDVFAPLAQGYEALRAGNDEKARLEFEKVIAVDPYNPFALNNLAVLAERQGKLKEAMAYLLDAEIYAAEYLHQADEICEGGGLCLAARPTAQKSQTSSIASIIRSNIDLLRTKMSKASNPDK